MKKDAIIDLIENDLNEMRRLVETFRDPEKIANAFIELLCQKHESLGKEISLLNYWASDNIGNLGKSELVAEVKANRPKTLVDEPIQTSLNTQSDGVRNVVNEKEWVKSDGSSDIRIGKAEDNGAQKQEQPQRPQSRDEIPDYFSEELESMQDPLECFSDLSAVEGSAQQQQSEDAGPCDAPTQDAPLNVVKQDETAARSVAQTAAASHRGENEAQGHLKASATDIANYGTPVDDLIKAIGINDRFLYQRELFKGNKMAFDAAVETVNAATSYGQAYQYLRQSFGWDETDPTVEAFLKAVHRRFL